MDDTEKVQPSTAVTTIQITEYFRKWAAGESITELEEICYQDAMMFIQWSSKHGASQRR